MSQTWSMPALLDVSHRCISGLKKLPQSVQVDHLDIQFLRLCELRSRLFTGQQIRCLVRHAARDLAPFSLDKRFRLIARHIGQRSCNHEGHPGKRPVLRYLGRVGILPADAEILQLTHDIEIVFLIQKISDALRHDRPDIGHFYERFCIGIDNGLKVAEVCRQVRGRSLANITDSQVILNARETRRFACLDGEDHIGR